MIDVDDIDEGRIIQGDCIEVMEDMKDDSVDLVLTDPPYGANIKYDNYNDTKPKLKEFIKEFMLEMLRVGKRVILTSGVENMYYYPKPKWVIAWSFNSPLRVEWNFFNSWQPVLVYGEPLNFDESNRRPDKIKTSSTSSDFDHPCPKPLELWEELLIIGSKERDLVLDPFLGSGTTAVACKKFNRRYIGIEISEKYCDIARERVKNTVQRNSLDEWF